MDGQEGLEMKDRKQMDKGRKKSKIRTRACTHPVLVLVGAFGALHHHAFLATRCWIFRRQALGHVIVRPPASRPRAAARRNLAPKPSDLQPPRRGQFLQRQVEEVGGIFAYEGIVRLSS